MIKHYVKGRTLAELIDLDAELLEGGNPLGFTLKIEEYTKTYLNTIRLMILEAKR